MRYRNDVFLTLVPLESGDQCAHKSAGSMAALRNSLPIHQWSLKKPVDLNRASTGSVQDMKLAFILPLAVVGLAGLVVFTLAGCKSATERRVSSEELAASCTLLAMSPEERSAHERRLNDLRKAARLERETAEGFNFTVDLRTMSSHELGLWMENEQKCCSFLKMSRAVDEANCVAQIRTECPRELRAQVMRIFGLRSIEAGR